MQERALFSTHQRAVDAARNRAIACGCTHEQAHRFCAAYPVHKQGQMLGYEGWYPYNSAVAHHDNLFRTPVLEHEA